jgi:hypothetical protein
MSEFISHWPDVRDKPAFLHRLMLELAGDSRISLEGDLSRCQFSDELIVSYDDTGLLKRNTLYPRQDFVVLRLTKETVGPIFEQISSAGLKSAIIHVQIERHEAMELGAYDNFHRECVVTGPGVSADLLAELKNVIRSFTVATKS